MTLCSLADMVTRPFVGGTKKSRKMALMKNGSQLLEKLITLFDGKTNPIRNFLAEELERATDNYDPRKVLTADSGYKLYKGFLHDRLVCVKKFVDSSEQFEYCINDIVYASKMSAHNNFLKLLGCCLETHIPILVFEHVGDATLADHVYGATKDLLPPLLWTHRLKIAMDMANAVAYLHYAFSRPIVFRNIKPLNIFLNENHVAKLSDFSISVSIPEGESHVWDGVAGATGLIAPEYWATGSCNEKQDVFNFGVFLFMLLSGKPAVDFSRGGEPFLTHHVMACIEDNRFSEIVDSVITGEGRLPEKEQQLQAFASVALKCISESAEARPTMIDVAKDLRKIYKSAASC